MIETENDPRKHDTGAKITEEGLAELRSRIGTGRARKGRNTVATADNIRHWAWGYGDDNPLWCDPDYARKSRWGRTIAPPTFLETFGRMQSGGLAGVHSLWTGDEWEFFLPVLVDDKISFIGGLIEVSEKPSALAGRTVEQITETIYRNQEEKIVAKRRCYLRRFERDSARERGKHSTYDRPNYTTEDIKSIEADYDKEELRGGLPRYWEDVNPGDSLSHVVKGPLTLTDIIAFYMGHRNSAHVWAHKMFLQYRRRVPAAASLNEFGVPDAIERVHYDSEWAKAVGLGAPYDYGDQRVAWVTHLLTNWMGDSGFLRKLQVEIRRPNYVGDTTRVRGEVTGKRMDGDEHLVECRLWAENQREKHTTGNATIRLPTRHDVSLPR